MSATPVNPLRSDPSFAAAREQIAAGRLGQRLAVYAAARAGERLDDPLAALGLPLIDELLTGCGERPAQVTAVRAGGESGFEQWSLILAFPAGLRASLDLGAGLGAAQTATLDLRVEWSGAERVILIEPGRVAVTVTNERGVGHRSAEVRPLAEALLAFAAQARELAADPPPAWRPAAAVIAAARESASLAKPVHIRR